MCGLSLRSLKEVTARVRHINDLECNHSQTSHCWGVWLSVGNWGGPYLHYAGSVDTISWAGKWKRLD